MIEELKAKRSPELREIERQIQEKTDQVARLRDKIRVAEHSAQRKGWEEERKRLVREIDALDDKWTRLLV